MRIQLWSRTEGLVKPPEQLVHAEPGSRVFPGTFRTRVKQWSVEAAGGLTDYAPMGEVVNPGDETMEFLFQKLCAAYGRDLLVEAAAFGPAISQFYRSARKQIPAHLQLCSDVEVMDYIGAVFQVTGYVAERSGGRGDAYAQEIAEPLNRVFEEEGVGYRWLDGRLVRFDEQVIHEQAMAPALAALASGRFGAAEGEFRSALDAFGRGDWRDTLTHANAAFESVLKIVTRATGEAGKLIAVARDSGAIPPYLAGSADQLAKLMHAVPAARGQQGSAHGLGDREVEADERLARLVLTSSAAFIIFLADTP